MGHDGGWHDGLGAGGWILMAVLMLMFWTVVVGGAIWLVRGSRSYHGPSSSQARHILDERFARGEMTEDEYRQRRDLLTSR